MSVPPGDGVGAGHDPGFLGAGALEVPLPTPAATTGEVVRLEYTHFTVLLATGRRFAVATAVDLDGSALLDLERADDWRLEPRVPASSQVGAEVYADNDLDRGHLVRRRDPVWGAPDVAARANEDTFVYPNAAPQAAAFNQSPELWLGLEDYLLESADAEDARLVVLTAPVLATDDPPYRGVQVPRRFWKVAAWNRQGALAATAYLLDQSSLLDVVLAEEAGAPMNEDEVAQVLELGPFRTFQVPVTDVADLTGLALGPLPAADRYQPPADGTVVEPPARPGWRPLTSVADIALGAVAPSARRSGR
ncbi:MAG: DNA/RNA non-specific endonuclease [Dermatophilaceae bacterium]